LKRKSGGIPLGLTPSRPRIKHPRSAKKKIELEDLRYQKNLEALVTARTEKLIQSNLPRTDLRSLVQRLLPRTP